MDGEVNLLARRVSRLELQVDTLQKMLSLKDMQITVDKTYRLTCDHVLSVRKLLDDILAKLDRIEERLDRIERRLG